MNITDDFVWLVIRTDRTTNKRVMMTAYTKENAEWFRYLWNRTNRDNRTHVWRVANRTKIQTHFDYHYRRGTA